MDIDDDSEDGKGCDEAGLPTKWQVQSHCECGQELNEDNRPKHCSGCGIEGCQICLKACADAYLCRADKRPELYNDECLAEMHKRLDKTIMDVAKKLHKFINNEDKK